MGATAVSNPRLQLVTVATYFVWISSENIMITLFINNISPFPPEDGNAELWLWTFLCGLGYFGGGGDLRGLVGSGLDHRSLPPEFEIRRGHIWKMFTKRLQNTKHLGYSGIKWSDDVFTDLIRGCCYCSCCCYCCWNMDYKGLGYWVHINGVDVCCVVITLSSNDDVFAIYLMISPLSTI